MCVPLRRLDRSSLPTAGGKAANLGELLRGGFPVPPGFCVTTAAYSLLVERCGLAGRMAAALARGGDDASDLRQAFLEAEMPPEIADAVRTAYRELGPGPVAVRSSATAEDLAGAAFAGQQESFLNIVGESALLEAVRACWASLWTDRAVAYRRRQGIDQATVKLAVVVQRLVPAELAGVLFTANPVTGARDETVIDFNPGLGEAVVSGQVTPDHAVLRRRWGAWTVVERQAGRREVVVSPRPGGGTESLAPADPSAAGATLPDRELRRLAALGAGVQRHFGAPQDIEWAWTGGTIHLVQARPMTALPPPPRRRSAPAPMLGGMAAELAPARPYPLDVTAWVPALTRAVDPLLALAGIASPFGRLLVVEDGVVLRIAEGLRPRPTARTLLAPFWIIRLALRYDPLRWRSDPLVAEAHRCAHDLEARGLTRLPWPELLDTVRQAQGIPAMAGELRRRYFPRAALATGALWLLLWSAGARDRLATLLSGAESDTLRANGELEDLAGAIRSETALAEAFSDHVAGELPALLAADPRGRDLLHRLQGFLDRYGHREAATTLMTAPTWKDAPEIVLGILRGLARGERRQEVARPAWQTARDEVLARRLLRLLRPAFLGLLAEARCLLPMREDTHFLAMLAMPPLRRAALEMGRRLTAAGVLDVAEDVFHLTLADLEGVGAPWPPPASLATSLRERVRRRRARRAALGDRPLGGDLPVHAPWAGAGGVGEVLLRGAPGSPGSAEGSVRVIRDAAAFGSLQPGEVLVAPFTNPAWTPLFARAAAVVVDSGGAASHAAIVAREYGIPAVMGAADATRRLVDGQRVRVDGSRGAVLDASPQDPGPGRP